MYNSTPVPAFSKQWDFIFTNEFCLTFANGFPTLKHKFLTQSFTAELQLPVLWPKKWSIFASNSSEWSVESRNQKRVNCISKWRSWCQLSYERYFEVIKSHPRSKIPKKVKFRTWIKYNKLYINCTLLTSALWRKVSRDQNRSFEVKNLKKVKF